VRMIAGVEIVCLVRKQSCVGEMEMSVSAGVGMG
jgi:hypothetical protein